MDYNELKLAIYESDGHSKKLKARHNAKKRNIEKRFYDNMNYKHIYTDKNGDKYGTVQRGDGPKTNIIIKNKEYKNDTSYDSSENTININKKDVQIKGSDLAGSHEYSHAIDARKIKDMVLSGKKRSLNTAERELNKNTGYDKLSKESSRKFKIKDSHDKSGDEMRADNYAITTTKGENNSNRLKKYIDISNKRTIQSIKDSKLNEIDNSISKDIIKKYRKNKVKQKANLISTKGKEDNKKRKQANDYILKKQKEEK